jgi:aryl carrier-like protein
MAGVKQQKFVVMMEDESTYEPLVDQRDAVAFERSNLYTENGIHTRLRYMAWNAMRRTQEMKLSFDKFNEQCIDAWPEKEETEDVDPTQMDQP